MAEVTCAKVECINGEVEVRDILDTINCIIDGCTLIETCCDDMKTYNKIRTYREPGVPNVLYMTDDGSDPHP